MMATQPRAGKEHTDEVVEALVVHEAPDVGRQRRDVRIHEVEHSAVGSCAMCQQPTRAWLLPPPQPWSR